MGIRAEIKLSAGRKCAYCKRPMLSAAQAAALPEDPVALGRAASIEHVHAQAHGGTNDPINLIVVCTRCNNLRGNLSYRVFCEFARNVLHQYPNAPTVLLRKVLRDFVDALAESAVNNRRSVRASVQWTLLVNADQLQQEKR